jgi:hypothetical protein
MDLVLDRPPSRLLFGGDDHPRPMAQEQLQIRAG